MINYLEEIESEYSRIRGKWSPLSPVDWNLADVWEKKKIPLNIVLRAMSETWRNFEAKGTKGTINTLRYFEPEVEKQFAEWLSSQIGRNTDENNSGESFTEQTDFSHEYAAHIETDILPQFDLERFDKLPSALQYQIPKTRAALVILIEEIRAEPMSFDDVENNLKEIGKDLDYKLFAEFGLPELTLFAL